MSSSSQYQNLATVMGTVPSLSIHRRFATLNAKNLLYMQAELMNLEAELIDIASEDKWCIDEKRNALESSWDLFKGSSEDPQTSLQWKKMMEIREKLKDYS